MSYTICSARAAEAARLEATALLEYWTRHARLDREELPKTILDPPRLRDTVLWPVVEDRWLRAAGIDPTPGDTLRLLLLVGGTHGTVRRAAR